MIIAGKFCSSPWTRVRGVRPLGRVWGLAGLPRWTELPVHVSIGRRTSGPRGRISFCSRSRRRARYFCSRSTRRWSHQGPSSACRPFTFLRSPHLSFSPGDSVAGPVVGARPLGPCASGQWHRSAPACRAAATQATAGDSDRIGRTLPRHRAFRRSQANTKPGAVGSVPPQRQPGRNFLYWMRVGRTDSGPYRRILSSS